MKRLLILLFIALLLFFLLTFVRSIRKKEIIINSRNNAVEILTGSQFRLGTGFFISDKYVITALHVIMTSMEFKEGSLHLYIIQPLWIKTNYGEIIPVSCVSPSNNDITYQVNSDFAILKLALKPKKQIKILQLAQNDNSLNIGSEILFSGYPLHSSMMLTHRGIISGVDENNNYIGIQAAINKGNSGGALLSSNGLILGIIDQREGGISKGLNDLRININHNYRQGDLSMGGIDPIMAINDFIDTLDMYISTGIGYAVNIKYLREYLIKYPEFLSNRG